VATEIDLLMRRIVEVLDYFDEEREIPWNYVQRAGDGRFEAIATCLLNNEAREHSVGVFATRDHAAEALQQHLRAVEEPLG
jgi:hypothetical protein